VVVSLVSALFFTFPTTSPTLLWMVLGERLSEGYLLYVDIIDDTGPLSAGVFMAIHSVFGRSEWVYELLGIILVGTQIYYWNSTLIKFRVFDENTYLPAIIMAALFYFSFDLRQLSPTLLGSTFLILALGQLFSQTVLQKESNESTLLIGIYGGLATGFHLHFLFFLPYLIFSGLVISGFSFRQLFLTLIGFALPIISILLFYYWNDGLEQALQVWPIFFSYPSYSYQPMLSWLIPAIFPLLLAIVGYIFGGILRGSTINQQKQRQLILLLLFFSSTLFFLFKNQASYQLVIFIPGLTYLITHLFLHLNWGIIAKPAFYGLTLGLPFLGMNYWNSRTSQDSTYFVLEDSPHIIPKRKSILVMGNDPSPYLNISLGGPFLNYNMSKSYLNREKKLEEKAQIYYMIQKQAPELILDEEGQFNILLQELPILQKNYQETSPGLYEKK